MHAICYILSKRSLSFYDVEEIMAPYFEDSIVERLVGIYGDYIPPDAKEWPDFHWDYYDIVNTKPLQRIKFEDICHCYVLIDHTNFDEVVTCKPDGKDNAAAFEEYCRDACRRVKKAYLTEINYHC